MDNNKRNFPRSVSNIALSIGVNGKEISGAALDLTVNGLAIKVEAPIDIGAKIELFVAANQSIKTKRLRGEVLRCHLVKSDPSYYRLAVKLTEPDDEYLMDSLALIHQKIPPLA